MTRGLNTIEDSRARVVDVVLLQPLAFPHESHAFLFELELLYLPACGLRVIVDPEDVLGYWKFDISFMAAQSSTAGYRRYPTYPDDDSTSPEPTSSPHPP